MLFRAGARGVSGAVGTCTLLPVPTSGTPHAHTEEAGAIPALTRNRDRRFPSSEGDASRTLAEHGVAPSVEECRVGPGVPSSAHRADPWVVSTKVFDAQAISPLERSSLIVGGWCGSMVGTGCHARSRAKKVPVKIRSAARPQPTVATGTPRRHRLLAALGASLLLISAGLVAGATPATAAPPAVVSGEACAAGTGVTVGASNVASAPPTARSNGWTAP